jgi:hypothetical protein
MSTKRRWYAGAIRRAGASRAPCENGVEPRCRARRPLAAAKACAAKDSVRPGPEDEPLRRAAVADDAGVAAGDQPRLSASGIFA